MRAINPILDSTFGKALGLSLLLHALLLTAVDWSVEPASSGAAMREAQFEVTLRAPELPAELELPQFPDPSPPNAARPAAPAKPPRGLTVHPGSKSNEAARQAKAQLDRQLFYPLEAIARGLEGDVLVQLRLDEAGNVIASRLEASSGHTLLDDAAVRAASTLRALPDSVPREVLLPVRFRLR